MRCPHCGIGIHEDWSVCTIVKRDRQEWQACYRQCPECEKYIIRLDGFIYSKLGKSSQRIIDKFSRLVYPKTPARGPIPKEVPREFSGDYNEACLVLADSPKASAALSRRCLQRLLVEKEKAKGKLLAEDIDRVLQSKHLPSYIANDLDAVRNVGNFAAHPIKNEHTGEIVDVEPGEAGWQLEILEQLFDFYFVQPAKSAQRQKELNEKLKSAGKKSMKIP